MRNIGFSFTAIILVLWFQVFCCMADSLSPLKDAQVPHNLDQLWKDYDPRAEPLAVEILEEWEDDGVICRVIRYCVGTFKGQKAMMAALYGFPRGGKNLPGLVQIHGGGQHANLNAVMTNARRGYACISINWLGNQMTGLREGKPWKWAGANTDWGYVDATQNTHNSHFGSLAPDEKTIDDIESPRNSNWFLGIIAARRAVTFLQQQPEVDGSRLGIYGHSMGAKLTFDTSAIDKRIKAAAPSSGGQANNKEGLYGKTIATYAYYAKQTCPTMFLNPSNDFHGTIDDIEETVDGMVSNNYRLSRVPHLNHRTQPEHVACGLLWFDQHLKDAFIIPKIPQTRLTLKNKRGVPEFHVDPDASRPVKCVEVYYTWGKKATDRFWHYVRPDSRGDQWIAELGVLSLDEPLRVYANVTYSLEEPVAGASYYYQIYSVREFTLSSRMHTVTPEMLKNEAVAVTEKPSLLIEAFGPDWKNEWYTFNYEDKWPWRSRKLSDLKWQSPKSAVLVIDIKAEHPNMIVIKLDDYRAVSKLSGGDQWETITFCPEDFTHSKLKSKLTEFKSFAEIVIGPVENTDMGQPEIELGGGWSGALPEFRNLRWVQCAVDE